MAFQLLKIVAPLFVAVWVGVLSWQLLKGRDDDWPQGGAAA